MWYPHRARPGTRLAGTEDGGNSWRQRPWGFFVGIAMTTSTHSYHGYELALHHESDDRYRVTIFDPKGNRIASTRTHLERQGALTEASRRVNQLLAQRRTTSGSFPRHWRKSTHLKWVGATGCPLLGVNQGGHGAIPKRTFCILP